MRRRFRLFAFGFLRFFRLFLRLRRGSFRRLAFGFRARVFRSRLFFRRFCGAFLLFRVTLFLRDSLFFRVGAIALFFENRQLFQNVGKLLFRRK